MANAQRVDGPALAGIAVALVTWASAFAAIAYALPAFTPGELALVRLLIGSLCLAALMAVRHRALPPRREWLRAGALGAAGLTVYHVCLNYAEIRVPSGTAAIVIALVPAATALLSALWLRERLSRRAWAGLGVALAGTVLVVGASGQDVALDPLTLLLLLCVASAAVLFVGEKPLMARHGALPVTTLLFFGATLAALPFGWRLPLALVQAGWRETLAAAWLGIGPMFVGYLAWNYAVARASASRVASFMYLMPAIALLISWLWLGEVPSPWVLAGGAVIIAGVALTNLERPRQPHRPQGQAAAALPSAVTRGGR